MDNLLAKITYILSRIEFIEDKVYRYYSTYLIIVQKSKKCFHFSGKAFSL